MRDKDIGNFPFKISLCRFYTSIILQPSFRIFISVLKMYNILITSSFCHAPIFNFKMEPLILTGPNSSHFDQLIAYKTNIDHQV